MDPDSILNPIEKFRFYRRNLPHFEQPGSVYFITFKTANGFVLLDEAKEIVFASVKFHADKKYRLYAYVVMETHVHLILQPLEESASAFYSIAQIMHSIKSYSAHRIKKILNGVDNVWLDENYDRIIRDDKEYLGKLNYIRNNPVEAGITQKPEDYRWLFFDTTEEKLLH
jgi:REP element-mobilizing transposase RayT